MSMFQELAKLRLVKYWRLPGSQLTLSYRQFQHKLRKEDLRKVWCRGRLAVP